MDSETDQNLETVEAADSKPGFQPNSFLGTLIVAVVLCLVCSLVVSTSAVALRPLQERNKANKMKRNVLIAAGIWQAGQHTDADIEKLFESIKTVAVNLPGRDSSAPEAGTLSDEIDIATYDQLRAAKDPELSIIIGDQDVAGIRRRERISLAYLSENEAGELESIILPIYGKGLWSTLYGYLALEADGRTVRGLTFYQHGETPGLGGEVDNPRWKGQWQGKILVDETGQPVVEVTRPGAADGDHQIDGISGATITSSGVEKTVKYWLGPDAFGPFLDKQRK